MKNIRAHLQVSGRVQGVAFRWSARDAAQTFGVTGWVRNLPDGRVEMVIEGPEEAVERMISWAHRGPSGAWVSDVRISREDHRGEYRSFSITRY